MLKIHNKIVAVYTAAKAGWIASSCKTGCVIDNENEEIRPCLLHAQEIAALAQRNEAASS